ncbi:MAG: hypothetical protein JWO20_99 [Candidatus Angelobacter sp.]|nr:hypothetical protein [Candidatus Angelobacter sp.]
MRLVVLWKVVSFKTATLKQSLRNDSGQRICSELADWMLNQAAFIQLYRTVWKCHVNSGLTFTSEPYRDSVEPATLQGRTR